MYLKLMISIWILISIIVSCDNNSIDNGKLRNNKCVQIEVLGEINHLLQIDSIFSGFKAIPLETKNECLISNILKIRICEGKMFLLDKRNSLMVFNTSGKFLYTIGKMGKGPGEYLELRDFDIDKNGNIYILDFRKIHVFNNNGAFVKKFSFNLSKIRCNPFEFSVKKDGNFYVWGGTLELRNNPDGSFFQIYEMTEKGKIINTYFPLKHTETLGLHIHRFIPYKDLTLIDPSFGSNIIYSIDEEGIVNKRWSINFGEKTLNIPIPETFNSLGDFKTEVDRLYYNTINGFNETTEWINFMFFYKRKIYNVYYSKILSKSFASMVYPSVPGRIAPSRIFDIYNDDFITLLEPESIIESIKSCKERNLRGLSASEQIIVEQLKQIKPTDNPILFICSLKKY